MAQIRNRFDIKNSIYDDVYGNTKRLPNFFDSNDEIKPINGILVSILLHAIFVITLSVLSAIMGLVYPHLPKPELPNRDIEFKLVQNESKPPINKNTKIRSDRDSRAGGKHNPKRAITEPSNAANTPAQKSAPKKQQSAKSQNPIKQITKTVSKPVVQQKPVVTTPVKQKTAQTQPPVVKQLSKPTPAKAPVAAKPTNKQQGVSAPTVPRVATVPKGPFTVPVPSSKAPVGSTYKPYGATGGSSSGGTKTGGTYSPSPQFSSASGRGGSGGSSGGSGGSKYAARGGSGGYGSGGNPGPGNPNGAPGIDAIRQPNWGPYMRDLEQRIKRNWTPPKGDTSKRIIITFTIGRDGRLLSRTITKSSGVPLADRAAMNAIELTAPFRPLPPEFRGSSVPIEFTFDYNVLNSSLK